MSAHTPTPWKYGVRKNNSIWLSLGNPSAGPHYQGDLYASEADARLIAAAPYLLEALKEVFEYDLTTFSMQIHDMVSDVITMAEGGEA